HRLLCGFFQLGNQRVEHAEEGVGIAEIVDRSHQDLQHGHARQVERRRQAQLYDPPNLRVYPVLDADLLAQALFICRTARQPDGGLLQLSHQEIYQILAPLGWLEGGDRVDPVDVEAVALGMLDGIGDGLARGSEQENALDGAVFLEVQTADHRLDHRTEFGRGLVKVFGERLGVQTVLAPQLVDAYRNDSASAHEWRFPRSPAPDRLLALLAHLPLDFVKIVALRQRGQGRNT